jgi:hypothetical protein
MATFQTKYFNTVLKAKNYASCLAASLVDREKYGDDVECGEKMLVLLTNLIETAEIHYCFNYDENGTITPEYECLTYDQAQNLIANINLLMK